MNSGRLVPAIGALVFACCAKDPMPTQDAGIAAGSPAHAGAGMTAAGQGVPSAGALPNHDTGLGGMGAAMGSDDIFGLEVPREAAYWTGHGQVHFGGQQVRLYGLNWFGLETTTLALFGPNETGRGVADFIAQVKALGFTALRIPLAPQSINPGHASARWAVRGELDTGRAHLDELLQVAAETRMRLVLDIHTCSAAVGYRAGAPDDSLCGGYTIDDWISDLETLADLADSYAPWVAGIDLFNEPHKLDWDSWRELAERGGEAVLRRNPRIVVFVAGVANVGYVGSDAVFWGENLTLAGVEPVRLPASRVVYSPHVYGPSVSPQRYFEHSSFPRNMPGIWDLHFGFLYSESSGPVVIPGEFGGRYEGPDKIWQDAFVDYLIERQAPGFFYWALNPNSGDTGGLLQSDWRSVHEGKLTLLQRLMP